MKNNKICAVQYDLSHIVLHVLIIIKIWQHIQNYAFKNHIYTMKNRNIQIYALHIKNYKICKIKLCTLDLFTMIQTCSLFSYSLDC
jgi:hypothetical protein